MDIISVFELLYITQLRFWEQISTILLYFISRMETMVIMFMKRSLLQIITDD